MDQLQFEQIIQNRVDELLAMLASKGDEYALSDRLSNFKAAAYLNRCTEEQVLWGYVTKHIIALSDFIQQPEVPTAAQWIEKLQDTAIYMLLLEAILVENKRVS